MARGILAALALALALAGSLSGCDPLSPTDTAVTQQRGLRGRPARPAFDPGPPSDPMAPDGVPFIGEPGDDDVGRPLMRPDATALTALLRARRFDDLDAAMLAYQAAFEEDPRKESWPRAAVRAFEVGAPGFGPLLDAWVTAKPTSFGARAARGAWRMSMGWAARGLTPPSGRTAELSEAVDRECQAALLDLNASLELRPRLLAAIDAKLGAQALLELPIEKRRLTYEHGLAVCPTCWTVRASWVLSLAPEQGGSIESMRAAVESAQPHLQANPALALLPALIDVDSCSWAGREFGAEASLQACQRATQLGAEPRGSCAYGQVLLRRDRIEDALTQFEAGLRVDPQWRPCLVGRQRALRQQGRIEDAANDLLVARRLAPHSRDVELDIESMLDALGQEARGANTVGDRTREQRLLDLTEALSPSLAKQALPVAHIEPL